MTNYVWYPVTGDGQTKGTQFVWNGAQLNWNTSGDWDQGSTLVFQNPSLFPGAIPGSGGGTGAGASQGPGQDSVGLVAGDVSSAVFQFYTPNPSKGDPFIGSNDFSVDVLINSGTVDINNFLLSGLNQYAVADVIQLPTLDVEGATFKVEGSIVNAAVVTFPTITVPLAGTAGGVVPSTGGGTIDIGGGGTVQIAGSVQPQIILNFKDATNDLLALPGVSASAPAAFSGTIENFVAGDTIFLAGLTSPGSDTAAFNNGTLTISNGATMLAALPMSGSFTSSSFALSSANGGTDITIQSGTAVAGAASVAAAYQAVLRVPIPGGVTGTAATTEANAIAAGTDTITGYATTLTNLDQTLYTTLPSLVSIDAFYGNSPSSATLTAVAASTGTPAQVGGFYAASYLHGLGYSDANVWTIMASQWGADQSSAFNKLYNSFGTDYSDFIAAVYTREFGFAPSPTNLQTLVNDVPGVQALLGGSAGAATPIQVVSGIYGYLLYVGQTTPSLPTQYASAADAFLRAAANGTVNYGQELTQQFPSGTTAGLTVADPSVITVSSSNQLIDPGTGSFTIQFVAGSGTDTLVLHTGGTDQVSGFDPGSDILDISALLQGAGVDLGGDLTGLSKYLTVTDQGANALVQFDPTGQGAGGGAVAVLQGLGSTVTGLDSLLARGAIQAR